MGRKKLKKENEVLRERIAELQKEKELKREQFVNETIENVNNMLSKIGIVEWQIDMQRNDIHRLNYREITFKVQL